MPLFGFHNHFLVSKGLWKLFYCSSLNSVIFHCLHFFSLARGINFTPKANIQSFSTLVDPCIDPYAIPNSRHSIGLSERFSLCISIALFHSIEIRSLSTPMHNAFFFVFHICWFQPACTIMNPDSLSINLYDLQVFLSVFNLQSWPF